MILDEERKLTMHKDIYGFFKSEQVYKDLSIPWKVHIRFMSGSIIRADGLGYLARHHHAWSSRFVPVNQ